MSAVLVDVAEAVKDQINGHVFGFQFEAVRVHSKRKRTIEQLKELTVEVVPVMWQSSLADRGGASYAPVVDVFLRRKMGVPEQDQSTGEIPNEELDPLVELAQDIGVFFQPNQSIEDRDGWLDTYEAVWKEVKVMSGFITDSFSQTRVWQAQIRLTFEVST